MPYRARLITQKIEAEGEDRIYKVRSRIEQERNALGSFRVKGKIERLVAFNPHGSVWQGSAFGL